MRTFKAFPGRARPSLVAVAGSFAILALAASPAMAEFGVETFALSARTQNGTPDVQAGSHPYALNATIVLNEPGPTTGNLKDVKLELPPGLVGNPDATPKCTYQEFIRQVLAAGITPGHCPTDTVVGLASFYNLQPGSGEVKISSSAVYNLVPPAGVAAEFAYVGLETAPILLEESVRTGKDYGVTTTAPNITELQNIYASKVTIWGTPADPSHNDWRGECIRALGGGATSIAEATGLHEGEDELEGPLFFRSEGHEPEGLPESTGNCPAGVPPKPLLTMPTSCGKPLTATVSVDSWQEPGNFLGAEGQRTKSVSLPEMTGCESLSSAFAPQVSFKPEKSNGSSPTGAEVAVAVPQEGTEDPNGLGDADVKDGTLALPAGLELNASAANGLEGCSIAQAGYTGMKELEPTSEPGVQTPQFEEKVENPETGRMEATACPNASKFATVKIKSPLLEGELTGSIYLASPQNFMAGIQQNPFSSLIAFYGVAEEPNTGVIVKFPGNLLRNEATGQLTATIENTPQLPFSELRMQFFAGERASFATPAHCGTYTSLATVTPWSGGPAAKPTSEFPISSGPNGTACPGSALPFSPSMVAQSTSVTAGGFAPLSTVITRPDGQQDLQNVTLTYPPGVSAVLTGVAQCPEAQANAGSCPAASQIGEDSASIGVGSEPYTVTGGKVYLTGPYDGAPFGLSIVTPAQAGPFILQQGAPVVTRAKIEINPTTAQVTVTTTGAIPRIIEGIPLQVKQINVNVNRPNFAINPTSCEHMSVSGAIGGWEGASSAVSSPFQVGSCPNLPFHPQFSASTLGHTSKADGASLKVKIASAGLGQANIAKVDLTIPAILPTRLTTIQKACTESQFNTNPAGCPSASLIASATVHTPLLPDPLTGPVYFVSHGNAAFPDTEIILQGDGVELILDGHTQITKGVTYSHFETVPDAPFTSFEFNAPEGPYSIFGANGNLCQTEVKMPTRIVAQNGAVLEQSTTVEPEGCPNQITILSHAVKKRTLTLKVAVPAAGKLTVSAKGLSKVSKTTTGRGTVTLTLKAKGKHKLKTKVELTFTPSKGKRLAAVVAAKFKR